MIAKKLKNELKSFCNHLYDESTDGYLQLVKLECQNINIVNTSSDNLRKIVFQYINDKDTYISVNTTYIPKRVTENVRQFRALYIDIDLKDNELKNSTVYEIFILANEGKIPKPTMIVSSGGGLHIYWRIKNAPYGALSTWQELEDYLYFQLKQFGADIKATDCVRVLRLVSTINSKNNNVCELIHIDNKMEYSMYELREEFLNWSNRKKKKSYQLEFQQTKITDNKVIANSFFNSYSLHYQRAEDLVILCKSRKYKVTGYRNMILHCYAYWRGLVVRDIERLEIEVHELNNSFTEPLKETEIKAICKCILKKVDMFITYENELRAGLRPRLPKGSRDKPGYWYKNKTLIEKLNITEEEQKELKTIINEKEKYRRCATEKKEKQKAKRRNKDGLTPKQQELKELKIKVLELKEEGLSNRKIAKKFNLSEGTIRNILKK